MSGWIPRRKTDPALLDKFFYLLILFFLGGGYKERANKEPESYGDGERWRASGLLQRKQVTERSTLDQPPRVHSSWIWEERRHGAASPVRRRVTERSALIIQQLRSSPARFNHSFQDLPAQSPDYSRVFPARSPGLSATVPRVLQRPFRALPRPYMFISYSGKNRPRGDEWMKKT